jgi:hypothetical protein
MPDAVRVLGKIYEIERVSQFEAAGQCFDAKQLIKVDADLPLELAQDTLIHECIHALDYCMHLEMTERQVSALASGLTALIRDNPQLLAFLQQERVYGKKRNN